MTAARQGELYYDLVQLLLLEPGIAQDAAEEIAEQAVGLVRSSRICSCAGTGMEGVFVARNRRRVKITSPRRAKAAGAIIGYELEYCDTGGSAGWDTLESLRDPDMYEWEL